MKRKPPITENERLRPIDIPETVIRWCSRSASTAPPRLISPCTWTTKCGDLVVADRAEVIAKAVIAIVVDGLRSAWASGTKPSPALRAQVLAAATPLIRDELADAEATARTERQLAD
jgi:hypothetical protein